MKDTTQIHRNYLAQLQGLEQFRQQYQSAFSTASLERDDPELKRLTEAIAYCTANAEHSAHEALHTHEQSLVEQIHPYMVSPLPAKTILQVNASAKMKESYFIEAGTTFDVQSQNPATAIFKTCMPLRILPLQYSNFEQAPQGMNRVALSLRFDAFVPMSQAPGEVPIYLNVYNDINSTLALYRMLKHPDVTTKLYFDGQEQAMPAQLVFRQPQFAEGMHPIETSRNRMHFPYAQFFVYLKLDKAPTHWRSFTVQINVKKSPNQQPLSQDCFRPFCTPMINLQQSAAQTIWCDGTQSQYPLIASDLDADLAVHSVLGVYQQLDEQKLPVLNAILGNADNTYTLSHSAKHRFSLGLRIKESFAKPRNVTVMARWHQPAFSQQLWQKLKVVPFQIDIPGADWQLSEARQPCSVLAEHGLLTPFELLSVRAYDVVTPHQLNQLFYLFSAELAQEFACIVEGFGGIKSTSMANVFVITMPLQQSDLAIGDLFVDYFQDMVNDWFAVDNIRITR